MGNCMPRCPPAEEEEQEPEEACKGPEPGGSEAKVAGGGGDVGGKSGFRVKVLLTRGELEWLLLQLKEGGGGEEKRLGDVLGEIIESGRGKGKVTGDDHHEAAWKPSLESIMEIPEAQSF